MPTTIHVMKDESHLIKSTDDKTATIIISGRSLATKNCTSKLFSEIVDLYGKIIDFRSSKTKGLKFLIEIEELKFLPMIKHLKKLNCLIIESTIDNRRKLTHSDLLSLVIKVQSDFSNKIFN